MKQFFARYKPHYRESLQLAVPVVISQLGNTVAQTSDSVIVGHFASTISLAAVSLVNSIFVIPMIVGMGFAYGLTPLIAQHNSRKEYSSCGELLSNSLFINILISIVLFTCLYTGSVFVLNHLHQTPAVVAQAKPFLQLMGLSIIPLMIYQTFKQFAEGLGFTKQAMILSVSGNILNIFVGIVLVKGMFGIQSMGVLGVGYSTLIDRMLMATVMSVYVLNSKNFKNYLKGFTTKSISCVKSIKILKIGAPIALQYSFELTAFSGAAIIIGTMGDVQQAAHQVAISLAAMTYMISSGIASAATIKSGNYFGVSDHKGLRTSALSHYHIVILFMFCTAMLFSFGNHFLPYIYTTDKSVINIASQLLILAAVFQIFDGTQVVGLGILRGMGDVNIPTIATFLAYWVVGIPIGYLLGLKLGWGVKGVWYGLVLGLMVSSALMYLRFEYISKKHRSGIGR